MAEGERSYVFLGGQFDGKKRLVFGCPYVVELTSVSMDFEAAVERQDWEGAKINRFRYRRVDAKSVANGSVRTFYVLDELSPQEGWNLVRRALGG